MRKSFVLLMCLFSFLLLSSCFNDKEKEHDALPEPEASLNIEQIDSTILKRQRDSISFTSTHHYTRNYNFIVNCDSIALYVQQPEEIVSMTEMPNELSEHMDTDSIMVYRNEQLVVAEIRIMPQDSIDSVWVQLARDQNSFGWIHESRLLQNVVPDDPISQFISLFSNKHILWMLISIGCILMFYVFHIIKRKGAKIVHFNDIASFYPTCLVMNVSLAATLYSSIINFQPEMWRHYYYHPTLNPFDVPLLLCAFLILTWLIPILCVAVVDDVRRHLPAEESILYLCGLSAVCMTDYVVFSVLTLYYIGYVLLAFYLYFSIKTFYCNRRLYYFCGRCGKALSTKGKCPYCGALNE